MKTKIFYSSEEQGATTEIKMNDWFKENPNINIEHLKTCCNKYCFWIVILYSERPLI